MPELHRRRSFSASTPISTGVLADVDLTFTVCSSHFDRGLGFHRPDTTTALEQDVMAIKSDAFGRVTLSDGDARKFERQATFGKPKAAAKASLKRGSEMLQSLRDNGGRITFNLKRG